MKKETIDLINNFVSDRDWDQFHNPKDLAISLSLEASELLELFQWKTSEEAIAENRSDMADELADILVYCVQFSEKLGFDIDEIIKNKMEANSKKYPVELAKSSKEKYYKLKRQEENK